MQKDKDQRIDYLELTVPDVQVARRFYEAAFGWVFTDYGPDYQAFTDGRLDGGFTTGGPPSDGGVLVVLYAADLAATEARVVEHGGAIVRPVFPFPGGRRFHFRDPSGRELAVWSDPLADSD